MFLNPTSATATTTSVSANAFSAFVFMVAIGKIKSFLKMDGGGVLT
jgi:hypothetical protein